MSESKKKKFESITSVEELVELVDFLRSDEGCPWDREQSSRSLKPYFLEEFYELLEAIEHEDPAAIREELGDVLLHLCFQVSLGREAGRFTLEDVVAMIRDKMIRRHPHVFHGRKFATREDQLFAWEQLKHREKAGEGEDEQAPPSVLDSLPRDLPALLRSYRIQGRVSKYSFDWDEPDEVFAKLEEEIAELREALAKGESEHVEEEIGDLLFSVVNLSRLLGVHPQLALDRTNRKFVRRFKQLERLLAADNKQLGELNLEQLDEYWDEVKRRERHS